MKICFTGLNEKETFTMIEDWLENVKPGGFAETKTMEITNE